MVDITLLNLGLRPEDTKGTKGRDGGEIINTNFTNLKTAVEAGASVEGTAVLSTGEGGGTKVLTEQGDGSSAWAEPAGGGAFSADGDTQITPSTAVVLDQATGDEAAVSWSYTVNKATSGDDYGHIINQIDTDSPGNSYWQAFRIGGVDKMLFHVEGGIDHTGSGATTAAHAQSLNLNWSAATAETSSGQYSAVVGFKNKATAQYTLAGGDTCTTSGTHGFCWGDTSTVTGVAGIAFGKFHIETAPYGFAANYWNELTGAAEKSAIFGYQGKLENRVTLGVAAGFFADKGDAQASFASLKISTTNATQTTLLADTTNYVIPADTTWAFSVLIAARSDESDGNDSAIYKIEGGLTRDESNNTAIVGSVTVTTIAEDAGAAAWDVTAEADDTNEALAIKVTGEAATNIRWVAKVDISQVSFA